MQETDYAIPVSVTPQYVLSIFQDEYRHLSQLGWALGVEGNLTFETTVLEWTCVSDIDSPPLKLGSWLNETWGTQCTELEWLDALTPENRRTLRDVCQLISASALRPQLRPIQIAGSTSLEASAFLAIKDCLAEDGVDVTEVAPSTPLEDYARQFPWPASTASLGSLQALSPIFAASSNQPVAAPMFGCLAWLLSVLGLVTELLQPGGVWLFLLGLALIVTDWCLRAEPTGLTFGDLETFRDLAHCIAAKAH